MAELNKKERPSKKRRIDTEEHGIDKTNPFIKGRQFDEIELKFDTGESLFVSKSFLSYASSVFETMFESKFKESNSQCVKLTGKNYDVFLDMLLYLHPRVQKPITGDMAKGIYKLAHEYDIPAVLQITDGILHKQVQELRCSQGFYGTRWGYVLDLDAAFEWLQFAETYGNRWLSSRAAERISVMHFYNVTTHDIYKELSDDTKLKILMYRLERCDKDVYSNDKLPLHF